MVAGGETFALAFQCYAHGTAAGATGKIQVHFDFQHGTRSSEGREKNLANGWGVTKQGFFWGTEELDTMLSCPWILLPPIQNSCLITPLTAFLLGSILGPCLLAIGDPLGIQHTADDVVADTRQIANAAAADQDDRVFLQVVPLAG